MKIAQLAPLTETVPPAFYGGTELVVSLLSEELLRAGHQVTLFAAGDSASAASLVSISPQSLRADKNIPQSRWAAYEIRLLLELQKRAAQFDIVHNHMGWQALPFLRTLDCPSITTIHNPIKDYCRDIFFQHKNLPYVSISNSYRQGNYPEQLNYVATVYNGIDVEAFAALKPKAQHLLFLGRICADKGTAAAIQVAQQLGCPLKIAGKLDDSEMEYFASQVRPHLDGRTIEYVGEVDMKGKLELLQSAQAVVYPIAFDEPFGLVMAEALAAGVPVMALDRGSVKEIIADGQTGIVCSSVSEMIRRFPEISTISPEACRLRVKQKFSKEQMAQQYLSTYEQVLDTVHLSSGASQK